MKRAVFVVVSRSEEHTSELQSHYSISYAVFCLGALIAHRLSTNREKGGVCGGLIASRLLAYHQLSPPLFDVELPVFRLDINSMIRHHFVPS